MQHLIHTYTSVYSISNDANYLCISILGGGNGSRLGDCSHRLMSLTAMLKKTIGCRVPLSPGMLTTIEACYGHPIYGCP